MLHGLDPVRHLWAISRKGIKLWARNKNIGARIYTAHLQDVVYSPYFKSGTSIVEKWQYFLGHKILKIFKGGAHLIAVLSHEK